MNYPQLYTGTSGLVLPVPNKSFYPEQFKDKSRLTYYSHLFNSIEINSSFYKLPRRETIDKWSKSVSDHFTFSFKLWRDITHQKDLVFNKKDIYRFMETISGAGSKKGCLLIQFPSKISDSYLDKIGSILNHIHQSGHSEGWNLQVECRNATLYNPATYAMLQEFNAGLVIHDIANSVTPCPSFETNTVYVRFHGPEKNYRGTYYNEVLARHATAIKAWLKKKKTVYVYFNNTLGGAVNNLLDINKILAIFTESSRAV